MNISLEEHRAETHDDIAVLPNGVYLDADGDVVIKKGNTTVLSVIDLFVYPVDAIRYPLVPFKGKLTFHV